KQFPDLKQDIEVIDVSTLNTWERYMKGSQGFNNFPNKFHVASLRNAINFIFSLDRMYTLPGLKNFFLAGQWVTSMGSLFSNAASGREVVQKICKQCGVRFNNA
ncbi:MAG: NAD(P)/FAD-dependent oxidoreductase, partial [Bacteroidota bacterium]|nr:NAD(P)/FAD-dependent oxidoreductase [Bacteroidota bacterium]